jgi:hypothetical protein
MISRFPIAPMPAQLFELFRQPVTIIHTIIDEAAFRPASPIANDGGRR